jgi:hypothetical protein
MNVGRNYSNTKSKEGSKFERKHDFGKCTNQIPLVVFLSQTLLKFQWLMVEVKKTWHRYTHFTVNLTSNCRW